MDNKPITIKDLARMLGISKSTVSRAMTDQNDIHPDTKKKILELAAKLNYERNALAINFKQRKTNTVGVIVPETINRFFSLALGGIQKRADMAGVNVMICQSNESRITEKKNLQSLISTRVDGLLVAVSRETDRSDPFATASEKGIPLVFFDRVCDDLHTSKVITNNYQIAFDGTSHLIDQGCRRIAFIAGPQQLNNSRQRFQGYRDALSSAGLPVLDAYIVHTRYPAENATVYTEYLLGLPKRPDAIFAINDNSAFEIMHVIKGHKLRVPNDIAVLGFNNESASAFMQPSLSSIHHPAEEIGYAAMEILLNHLHHPHLEPIERIVPSTLVVRESSLRRR